MFAGPIRLSNYYIVKPYNWTVDQTIQRLEYMRIVLSDLPPPSNTNQGPKDIQDWNPDLRTILAQDMRQIQFNCMPEGYQKKLNDLETDWIDLEGMPDQLWLDHLGGLRAKTRNNERLEKL